MMVTSSDVDTTDQSHAQRLQHVEMALQSLYHVIRANAGVEQKCIGHFKLLFALLAIQGAGNVQKLALQVCVCGVCVFCTFYIKLIFYFLPVGSISCHR